MSNGGCCGECGTGEFGLATGYSVGSRAGYGGGGGSRGDVLERGERQRSSASPNPSAARLCTASLPPFSYASQAMAKELAKTRAARAQVVMADKDSGIKGSGCKGSGKGGDFGGGGAEFSKRDAQGGGSIVAMVA